MMTARDRLVAALTHREGDRVPILEEIWPSTHTRWVAEGLPADVPFAQYLGIEEFLYIGIDDSLGFPVRTVEETPQQSLCWDANGALVQTRLDGVATPHVVRTTIHSPLEWAEHRERLVYSAERVNWEHVQGVSADAQQRGQFLHYNMPLGYERWLGIIGSEALLTALAESPGWVREMHEADVALHLAAAEELLSRGVRFDAARFSSDMGYCRGPAVLAANLSRGVHARLGAPVRVLSRPRHLLHPPFLRERVGADS